MIDIFDFFISMRPDYQHAHAVIGTNVSRLRIYAQQGAPNMSAGHNRKTPTYRALASYAIWFNTKPNAARYATLIGPVASQSLPRRDCRVDIGFGVA